MTGGPAKPRVLGRQQRFIEVPAAGILVGGWAYVAYSEGFAVGLKYIWILFFGAVYGIYIVRMRLQLRANNLELAILGPWRRSVNLDRLESIRWRQTGGPASKGTMIVQDRDGHRLPLYVGRLSGGEVWGRMLLDAAGKTGALIDAHSRRLLEAGLS